MATIDTKIPLVDRVQELEELKTHLTNATQGQGNLVFIAGEAGVGKTRLVEELKTYAQSQGVQILQGWSLYESLTPYMPFVEALRSANLDYLFSREDPPKVECVYLITDTVLLIKDVTREDTKLDSTIFAGMITAVGDFVKDSLTMLSGEQRRETLDTLGYEKYRILIESGKNTNLVVILTGRENEFLVNDMREVLVNVEKEYGNVLKTWDGDDNSVKGIDNLLRPLIESGKYDGIDYAKDDPQIKRNRLFENISLGIERHTKVNPSILCIEDLQWADPSSLALMHYIARNTRECNFLILGTYRPEDVSSIKEGEAHHLIDTMQRMSREDLYQQIELERLEERHIDEMLTSLLDKTDFSDEFKIQLYRETEGNPFFIVTLVRMLIAEKTIEKRNRAWVLTKKISEANIPSKVFDVIIRRLYRVKEKEREVLEYAAVIGDEFTSDILVQTGHYNKIELLKQLRNLEQNHKLIKSTESKYKFDHAKIKEVLYSQVPMELRKEYHAIIADSIESLNKDNLDEVIENLAFHYYQCKNNEKALHYLIKAAEKAKKDYSNEEAIDFYIKSLEYEVDDRKRRDIYDEIGDIFRLIGNNEKSIEFHNLAFELTKENRRKAEIKNKIGWRYENIGEYDESVRICNEALDLVRNEDCIEKAFALILIGYGHIRRGEYDLGQEYLEKSMEIEQKINDPLGLARLYTAFNLLYWYRGDYDKSISFEKKSLEIRGKIGDLREIGVSYSNLGFTYGRLGEYEKALNYFKNSQDIYLKVGYLGGVAYNWWGLAEVYYGKGDMKRALDSTKRAYKISKRIDQKEVIGETFQLFGMIYRKQRKWIESIKSFKKCNEIFKEINMKHELGKSYYEFGLMWKEKGDTEQAKEYFNKSLDIYENLNLKKYIEKVRKEL